MMGRARRRAKGVHQKDDEQDVGEYASSPGLSEFGLL